MTIFAANHWCNGNQTCIKYSGSKYNYRKFKYTSKSTKYKSALHSVIIKILNYKKINLKASQKVFENKTIIFFCPTKILLATNTSSLSNKYKYKYWKFKYKDKDKYEVQQIRW